MKTVATFATPEDAHNLRAFLEGCGIAAFVRDENMGASYSMAIGGVKVDVEDNDFERAVALHLSAFPGAPGASGLVQPPAEPTSPS